MALLPRQLCRGCSHRDLRRAISELLRSLYFLTVSIAVSLTLETSLCVEIGLRIQFIRAQIAAQKNALERRPKGAPFQSVPILAQKASDVYAQRKFAACRARLKTSRNMARVNLPVLVFCKDG